MANCSRSDVILVRYPFSDLANSKVRPAIVVSATHPSQDILIAPLTSKATGLGPGEFLLTAWQQAGLHIPTALKRGLYTVTESLVLKHLGKLDAADQNAVDASLRLWLGL